MKKTRRAVNTLLTFHKDKKYGNTISFATLFLLIFPTEAATKKLALKELKKRLIKLIEAEHE